MTQNEIMLAAWNKLCILKGEQPKQLNQNEFQMWKRDVDWLIESAEINAEYGYYPAYLIEHNATARDIINNFGDGAKDFVKKVGCIGWYQCAEDSQEVRKAWNNLEQWATA